MALLDALTPRLDRLSPFELLDVAPPGTDGEIQRAFHQKAAQLHPDLYRSMPALSPDDHERLETIYSRVAQAYVTLRDPEVRAQLSRSAPQRPGSAPPPAHLASLSAKAQSLYRRAEAALGTGDIASAVLNLRMALAAQPDSALLRSALAEAQGLLPRR